MSCEKHMWSMGKGRRLYLWEGLKGHPNTELKTINLLLPGYKKQYEVPGGRGISEAINCIAPMPSNPFARPLGMGGQPQENGSISADTWLLSSYAPLYLLLQLTMNCSCFQRGAQKWLMENILPAFILHLLLSYCIATCWPCLHSSAEFQLPPVAFSFSLHGLCILCFKTRMPPKKWCASTLKLYCSI